MSAEKVEAASGRCN